MLAVLVVVVLSPQAAKAPSITFCIRPEFSAATRDLAPLPALFSAKHRTTSLSPLLQLVDSLPKQDHERLRNDAAVLFSAVYKLSNERQPINVVQVGETSLLVLSALTPDKTR